MACSTGYTMRATLRRVSILRWLRWLADAEPELAVSRPLQPLARAITTTLGRASALPGMCSAMARPHYAVVSASPTREHSTILSRTHAGIPRTIRLMASREEWGRWVETLSTDRVPVLAAFAIRLP